jgi:hypothetical protein
VHPQGSHLLKSKEGTQVENLWWVACIVKEEFA